MKGDFSRRTHDPLKHYSAVLQEQGRLLTDADLEEEHRILSGEHERAAADLIGGCGGPIGASGFAVTTPDGVHLTLSGGRYYAAGKLVVNEETIDYTDQPDRFSDDLIWPPPTTGRYVIVLDVWRRLITALDDPGLREVALGGPTTAVREKTVWQVHHRPVAENWTCADALPDGPETTGAMAARAEPESVESTPCLVPPQAGYTGLENQFYRVEVFSTGTARDLATAQTLAVVGFPAGSTNQVELSPVDAAGLVVDDAVEIVRTGPGTNPLEATFAQVADVTGTVVTLTSRLPEFAPADTVVLRSVDAAVAISRENGSVVTGIGRIDGRDITVADLGPDEVLGFAPGQWVELTDDRVELERRPRQLRQIESIDSDRLVVTLRTSADPLEAGVDGVIAERHPKLRRWDGVRAVSFVADDSGWIHIENGIEVRFVAGDYVNGDYWHFPARAAVIDAASGKIEWPQSGTSPSEMPPLGIRHSFCALAVVDVSDGSPQTRVVSDCRDLFPAVTELTNLLFVGGDGQEARPQSPGFPQLPAPLTVRVANGSHPVEGAAVVFTGQGQLIPSAAVTDANGMLRCTWRLSPGIPAQSAEAHLLDAGGTPIPHQVVRFHATIDADAGGGHGSCCVCVGPGGEFERIDEAIKELLDRGERDLCLCLTAGVHFVDAIELSVPDPEGPPFHLSIKGCGRLSEVWIEGSMVIDGWESVRLLDLDVVLSSPTGIHLREVREVRLDNIHVTGRVGRTGLVRIHDAARVYVGRSVIEARAEERDTRIRDLFSGLGPLEAAWDRIDDPEFDTAIRTIDREIGSLTLEERRRGAEDMLAKAQDDAQQLSAGLLAVLARLAASISSERPPVRLGNDFSNLAAALAMQTDLVALEVGSGDDRQETMADPSSTTTAEIIVENNEIFGNVSFYGLPGGEPLNADERRRLAGMLKGGDRLGGLAGTVHLRDNRVGRLLISEGMLEALRQFALGNREDQLLTLYQNFLATNNVFDGEDSFALAEHIALTSNDFTLDALVRPSSPLVVLDLAADTCTATGNHGDTVSNAEGGLAAVQIVETTRQFAEVANLELDFA